MSPCMLCVNILFFIFLNFKKKCICVKPTSYHVTVTMLYVRVSVTCKSLILSLIHKFVIFV